MTGAERVCGLLLDEGFPPFPLERGGFITNQRDRPLDTVPVAKRDRSDLSSIRQLTQYPSGRPGRPEREAACFVTTAKFERKHDG